jgi:hypothetical protein
MSCVSCEEEGDISRGVQDDYVNFVFNDFFSRKSVVRFVDERHAACLSEMFLLLFFNHSKRDLTLGIKIVYKFGAK